MGIALAQRFVQRFEPTLFRQIAQSGEVFHGSTLLEK